MELSCPQCGLVLDLRGPQVEYCPRCIARRRQPVPLIAEMLKRMPAGGDERKKPSAPTRQDRIDAAMRAREAF